MSNASNTFKTGIAGAGLQAHADNSLHRFSGSDGAWLDELQALADRFGCGVSADMAAMDCAQLRALHGFLKAKARGA